MRIVTNKEREVHSAVSRVLGHYGFALRVEDSEKDVYVARFNPDWVVELEHYPDIHDPIKATLSVKGKPRGTMWNAAGLRAVLSHRLNEDHNPDPTSMRTSDNGLRRSGPCRTCGLDVVSVDLSFGDGDFDAWHH